MEEDVIEVPFCQKDIGLVEQKIQEVKGMQPLVTLITTAMIFFPLLIAFIADSGKRWPGILLAIFMLPFSLFFILIRKGTMIGLEEDVKKRMKIVGYFKIKDKKIIRSTKMSDSYIINFNSDKIRNLSVSFDFWNSAKPGDELYIEKSLHGGMILQISHLGINVKKESYDPL